MKIEKVNENQICCTLTREDLENRQIKISELAYGSEKAKMLFRDMIQQANSEFGFEANDIPLMVEAIPMAADSIILLITKVEYPEELDTRFSQFSDYDEEDYPELMNLEETIPEQGADDILGIFQKMHKESLDEITKASESLNHSSESVNISVDGHKQKEAEPEVLTDLVKIFEIQDMRQVERLSNVLCGFYMGENSLYKDEHKNCYELFLHKSNHTPVEFNKICNIACEYATQKSYSPALLAYYEEHGNVILANDALQVIKTLGDTEE